MYNGVVRTCAPGQRVARAIAFEEGNAEKSGRIVAVGGDEILSDYGAGAEKIDLAGHLVLPGFIDSHVHLALTGYSEGQLKLAGSKSCTEIVARGKRYIEKRIAAEGGWAEGEWIEGNGFDQNEFHVPTLPDRTTADAISLELPVMLTRSCYHIAVANSVLLKKLDPSAKCPGIERDEHGAFTGVVRENGIALLRRFRPAPSRQEIERRILFASKSMVRAGLTSIQSHDMGEGSEKTYVLDVFRDLARSGRLPLRVYEGSSPRGLKRLGEYLSCDEWKDPLPFFKLGFVKMVTDGSLGARSAYLREPYSDAPETRGWPSYTQDELEAYIFAAHGAGRQLAIHAIGDAALEQALIAMEKLPDSFGRRHRIVHMMTGDLTQYERARKLGLCADIQPSFLIQHFAMPDRLGARTATAYAWKTLLDLGIPLGGGSDSPIDTYDPLYGIYCAVTRQDRDGNPPDGHSPLERLSIEEAVNLYTRGSAYLAFEENEKGTLEPGKLADLVVLTRDIFTLPPKEILSAQVAMTWVNGVLSANESTPPL